MGFLIGFIIGLILGCVAGIFMVALVSANKNDDDFSSNCTNNCVYEDDGK